MKTQIIITLLLLNFIHVAGAQTQSKKLKEKPISTTSEGIKLAGSLYLPDIKKPKAIVVFIHGSAPTTRNDRYYNYLKPYFLEQGYAVVLYDKRGSGQSGGEKDALTDLNQLASDALSMIRAAKSIKKYEDTKIGIIGTSQGGWVGPLVATQSEDISFVCTISGPGTSMQEQNLYQSAQAMMDYGFTTIEANEATDYKAELYSYFQTAEGFEQIKILNESVAEKRWFGRLESYEQQIYPPEVIKNHEGFKRFRMDIYDPKPTLEKINVPLLAVFGDKDRHIPVERSIVRINKIFKDTGKSKLFTVKSFPNHGHLMQLVDTNKELLLSSKKTTEEQRTQYMIAFGISPDFVNYLLQWVEKVANE